MPLSQALGGWGYGQSFDPGLGRRSGSETGYHRSASHGHPDDLPPAVGDIARRSRLRSGRLPPVLSGAVGHSQYHSDDRPGSSPRGRPTPSGPGSLPQVDAAAIPESPLRPALAGGDHHQHAQTQSRLGTARAELSQPEPEEPPAGVAPRRGNS